MVKTLGSIRAEDYLKAIYTVSKVKGYARVKDLSRILGVSPATVTEMLRKLKNDGLINYEKYGGVTLTPKGMKLAEELVRKFEILKDFLIILGLDEESAAKDAHRIEHVVSPKTTDLLTKFVLFIKTRESPRWLQMFREYINSGNLPECPKKKEKNNRLPAS